MYVWEEFEEREREREERVMVRGEEFSL